MIYVIELLAPVGSKEALVAAIESGADAVYLGGKMFGARHYAPNFTDDELAEAVRFAHLRGVVVFVTVNTLLDDSEITALVGYLRHLYDIGVDAIIVQDIGVAVVAKKVVPNLPLHASTQMTAHNLEGVNFLADMGFERVVLARELPLNDIAYICKNSSVEIETFIHGALCISYSGQCLMSSMIGGRSGNRGRCAQPCRLPYTLVDASGNDVLSQADAGEYLLSPKDFNTVEILPELIDAGIASFKIEGRMKRPEYVAVVVDAYRRAIERYLLKTDKYNVDEQDRKDLAQIFNRDFTTAHLYGKNGRNMMSDRRPNNRGVRVGRVLTYQPAGKIAVIKLDEPLAIGDIIEFWVKVGGRVNVTVRSMTVNGLPVTEAQANTAVSISVSSPVRDNDRVFKIFDAKLMERARAYFSRAEAVRRIPVNVTVSVEVGKPMVITLQDSDGFTGQAQTAFIAEKALKRPLTADSVAKQIERMGTTIFSLSKLDCSIEGEVMVPISEINDARRRAVEHLEAARLAKFDRAALPKDKSITTLLPQLKTISPGNKPELVVNVDAVDKLKAAVENGADIVMFGGECFGKRVLSPEDYRNAVSYIRQHGRKIVFNTPRLLQQSQMAEIKENISLFNEIKPDAISVGNIGTFHLLKEFTDMPMHGDYPLNIYNSVTAKYFSDLGLASLTLSPELNFSQVEELAAKKLAPMECLVHGYLTLMISDYCMPGSFLGGKDIKNCNQACLRDQYWLKDRMDELFPIATDQFCRMHILNAKELSMLPHVPRLIRAGLSRLRFEAKYSSVKEVTRITRLYRELIDQGEHHPLIRQDKTAIEEHKNITRGHYFRGVL
ncbi:MAG: Peptidase family [Sporomusa sp.]|jgi:putative protease|nr:Peptidase family [Sporomusa sp.]